MKKSLRRRNEEREAGGDFIFFHHLSPACDGVCCLFVHPADPHFCLRRSLNHGTAVKVVVVRGVMTTFIFHFL